MNAGANAVISEEAVASGALIAWCEQFVLAKQETTNQKTLLMVRNPREVLCNLRARRFGGVLRQ
mgnify:CR=1 FL=1